MVKILTIATPLIETGIQVFHHIAGKAVTTRVVVDKLPYQPADTPAADEDAGGEG